MSRPANRTSPSTRAPGTVSCMRLRQRRSVDLPQPDGPMIAVTSPDGTSNPTSRTTRDAPKYASSDSTAIAGVSRMLTSSATAVAIGTSRSAPSVAAEPEAVSGDPSRGKTDDEDEGKEDERAGPRLRVPVVEGRNRIGVYL